MKQNYIINKNTMYLIMRKNPETNEDYTTVVEKDMTFDVLKNLDEITACSLRYYEEDKTSNSNVLKDFFGQKKLPLLISFDNYLVFINATLSSRNKEKILISNEWINMIRPVGNKTQIKFKNGMFKTISQSIHVITKQQLLCYSVIGVVGDAKRKGVWQDNQVKCL